MKFEIYIQDTKLDTFDDERISIKHSIVDSQDISKINGEFSREFTLPASKTNNAFFKHYYDADIDNSFDARTKKTGRIDLNGLPFRYGKFQLNKVNVKADKADSYSVEFVSNLIDLKKEIGKDELSDLDLSAYDHTFNAANVKTGLQSSLFSGDLVYTLCPKKQYYYSSDGTDTTDTETLTNIGWNVDAAVHGVRFTDLSPSIKVIRIIEAIEAAYPITFSRDFLGGADFTNLYMALVNKEDEVSLQFQEVDFDGGDTDFVNLTTNVGSFPVFASSSGSGIQKFNLRLTITPDVGFESVNYTVITYKDGAELSRATGVGTQAFEDILESEGSDTFDIRYEVESSASFSYTANLYQQKVNIDVGGVTTTDYNTTASSNSFTVEFKTSNNIPKVKIIEWLTGLFQAFKLVLIPQPDGTIYVQTLNVYYQSGTLWEVTEYVDFKTSFIERGEILNDINFSFEDPQTILNQQFTKNNGLPYGNEEARLFENPDGTGEPLDGESYEVEVPFETVVYDRLTDQDDDSLTTIMYAPLIDENLNPVVPEPFFHYVSSQPLAGNTIKYVGDNDALEQLTGVINTQCHSRFISGSGQSFLFSSEFSEWSGNLMSRSLYSTYHQEYIGSIFNIKRRSFLVNINLPYYILSSLGLGDVLKIKDRYYRIDNYDLDITTGKAKFTLINSFDNDLTGLTPGATSYQIDNEGGEIVIIISTDSVTDSLIDVGTGTSWVSIDNNKSTINVTVDENLTGDDRAVYLRLTDPTAIKGTTDIFISQNQ